MANSEHLEILKAGVEKWNKWRQHSKAITPDLSEASISGFNFSSANLCRVNLHGADLTLSGFSLATFTSADLSEADLSESDFSATDLRAVNFAGANFRGTNFRAADLRGASFRKARVCFTSFADTDLSEVIDLDAVQHDGPSSIGLDTFFASKGKIPHSFLRGAGVPDIFIEWAASLVDNPFEFCSAFISYSSKDLELAERLHADLQSKGVRCWFASENLKIGDKFRPKIDEAIRLHDKLLLLLSENSIASSWVEKEVESAFDRENREKRLVLFPVRLDNSVMESELGWPADIRRTRHIGDFTDWKDHDSYQKAFDRLLRDLKSEKPAK